MSTRRTRRPTIVSERATARKQQHQAHKLAGTARTDALVTAAIRHLRANAGCPQHVGLSAQRIATQAGLHVRTTQRALCRLTAAQQIRVIEPYQRPQLRRRGDGTWRHVKAGRATVYELVGATVLPPSRQGAGEPNVSQATNALSLAAVDARQDTALEEAVGVGGQSEPARRDPGRGSGFGCLNLGALRYGMRRRDDDWPIYDEARHR